MIIAGDCGIEGGEVKMKTFSVLFAFRAKMFNFLFESHWKMKKKIIILCKQDSLIVTLFEEKLKKIEIEFIF